GKYVKGQCDRDRNRAAYDYSKPRPVKATEPGALGAGQVIAIVRHRRAFFPRKVAKPRKLRARLSNKFGTAERRLNTSPLRTLQKSVTGMRATWAASVSGI